MKPHSLKTASIGPEPKLRFQPGSLESRHGPFVKGTVLPETQVSVCPRVKVIDFEDGFLKKSHIEKLEQNQTIASCCRHPENHDIEAFKSHPEEPAPDIYVFYCTCGRKHRFFCVGMEDERPMWDAS